MKKRNVRNFGIIVITILITPLLCSSALAGPGSKVQTKGKSTTEKNISEDKTEEKDDTKIVQPKNVKEVTVKKNNTIVEDKIKPIEKKKINVINFPKKNKTKNTTPVIQPDNVKNASSPEKVSIPSYERNFDYQKYKTETEQNKIRSEKFIESDKSLIHSNTASENEMIRNHLKGYTTGSGPEHFIPREVLNPQQIEDDDNTQIIIYNNIEYRYYYGYYYRPWDGYYWRIWPPFGFRISWLPPYYYDFWWDGIRYYYYCNVYYIYEDDDEKFIVVRPPIGAMVETLPEYSEKLIIEGETYFLADGVQYKAVLVNDEIWFQVIKVVDDTEYDVVQLPVGAVVDTIPNDRELIVIEGETYFIADNVQYKPVIVNDEIWFKVLKVG
ncbi:MAG TPA: hypothetical protein ENG70_05350 [Candidatus Cloacimonetes bacterium]|nr:hypothetical protein [Candidatus Cloacimonadota bacterium]HEX38264.1 hypothetical protein [Candidatus Cloacimonadota bacterium]